LAAGTLEFRTAGQTPPPPRARCWPQVSGQPEFPACKTSDTAPCRRTRRSATRLCRRLKSGFSSSQVTSLLGDFPVQRLLDPYQAPWPLLYRLRQITQVVGRHTYVLERIRDVLIVGANNRLQIADQGAGVRQRLLEFIEIGLDGRAQTRD